MFSKVLNKHAPLKTKFLRANNKPHLTKERRKAIMKRTRLKIFPIKQNVLKIWLIIGDKGI